MKSRIHHQRRGNIIVMTALMLTGVIAFAAFAVDLGYLYAVRVELQRCADASAIAAAWELIDKDGPAGTQTTTRLTTNASTKASQFAALNHVASEAPALGGGDVVVGYMANPSSPSDALITTPTGSLPNAVQIRVQRTSDQNGQVPLFFARVLGYDRESLTAQATAAYVSSFSGFKAPTNGDTLNILPFALDQDTWNNLTTAGSDDWSYNASTKTVSAGSDGVKEVNLYPQGTGSPGNRGTVDIGSSNNSTADIARQIVYGINSSDLAHLGGSIQFNSSGVLHLNGDTGISAGVKDELASIIGQPRMIPIFSSVVGPGNNADYTIVKFVGIRILDVKLTGSMSTKHVTIQPCNVVIKGGIYSSGATTTQYVYSPAWLVR
ncbi:MAG TPA: TadG family pilus assembly protein [Pirellulaceae bacterium]|jgi:Flp pilus assembly protein TadG